MGKRSKRGLSADTRAPAMEGCDLDDGTPVALTVTACDGSESVLEGADFKRHAGRKKRCALVAAVMESTEACAIATVDDAGEELARWERGPGGEWTRAK